jgi:hypothetical protein
MASSAYGEHAYLFCLFVDSLCLSERVSCELPMTGMNDESYLTEVDRF